MICQPARCGCSIQSSTLNVTGDGEPFIIDIPSALDGGLPIFNFLDEAERDAALPDPIDGTHAWLRGPHNLTYWDDAAGEWRFGRQGRTNFAPTIGGITLGSSTVTADYVIVYDMVFYRGRIIMGAGFSVSGGNITATLPKTPNTTVGRNDGSASAYDASVNFIVGFGTDIQSGILQTYRLSETENYFVSATEPFTWAVGDEFWWHVAYPMA
jgi:hypothetical protein